MENPVATDKYPEHKALEPFFDVVMNYDTIAEYAEIKFYRPRIS